MSHTDQLVRSSSRLRRQSLLFFQQTRLAGEAFVSETRAASVTFGDEIASATNKLVSTTGRSATILGRAFRKEAFNWRDLAIKTQDAYVQALKAQVNDLEGRAATVRESLRPTALETRVLRTSHDLLGSAQNLVDGRLEQATEAKKPAPRTATATTAKAATRKTGRSPIRNYDQLTARDVVARIQRLSGQQATALLDYEQTRKNRATVIRAAKQRLAAS
jgi:hypothetical protein